MSEVGQTPTPAAPPPADALPNTGAATPPPAAAPAPAPVEPAPAPAANPNQALLDRIDRLTREKYDLQSELQRRGTPPAAAPSGPLPSAAPVAPASPAPQAPAIDPVAFEDRVARGVQERLAAESFQRTVATIADAGLKAFPQEWAAGVANLQRINALDPESISAINELGDSHLIIHALSKDLNEAARIANLAPAARGVAYARLADKVKAAAQQQISQAPPPAGTEVGGTPPVGSAPSDRDSMDEWERKRKQTSRRWGGRG